MKNIIKKILKTTRLFHIKPKDNDLIKELKKTFEHSERSFSHGRLKYIVDSLYCHAAPGTLETVILELNKYKNYNTLLNLGGGDGQLSKIFEQLDLQTTNVDIEISKEDNRNIKFDLNSNKNLPLKEKSFDVIVAQEIIEHIENPWKLFRIAKKYIKNNGTFILTTPNIQSIKSKKLFSKKGYFEWFTPSALSYHVNPIPKWEIELISKKLKFNISKILGNGEYYFKKQNNIQKTIKNNETLIFILKNS